MAKASKFREMSIGELEQEVHNVSEQLFRLRFQKATGQMEGPLKMRQLRKDLARIKTVITEKRRAAAE